jgi:hypothetical protein
MVKKCIFGICQLDSVWIIPIFLATSKASQSGVSWTHAFFSPSGQIKVLTLATSL